MLRVETVLLGGKFLDGYVLEVIGPVTDAVSDDLGLSTLEIGLVDARQSGIFVGLPVLGNRQVRA